MDRFGRSLPDGQDSVLDGEGANMSGGREKQPLADAQAFLDRTSVLILGEATSSRTPALKYWRRRRCVPCGPTGLLLGSRTACPPRRWLILLMEAGQIVAQGTHTLLGSRKFVHVPTLRGNFHLPVYVARVTSQIGASSRCTSDFRFTSGVGKYGRCACPYSPVG